MKTVSPEVFDAIQAKLARFSESSVRAARAVLVDGRPQVDVAGEYGMSRQQLNRILSRVRQTLRDAPRDWVRVEVYLPPEYAAQVRELEARARADLDARNEKE